MGELEKDEGESPEFARRAFLKRMAAFAFAVPVVSSFSLDAVSSAKGTNQAATNQSFSNQSFFPIPPAFCDNQFFANQTLPTKSFLSQQFPNQYLANQPPHPQG